VKLGIRALAVVGLVVATAALTAAGASADEEEASRFASPDLASFTNPGVASQDQDQTAKAATGLASTYLSGLAPPAAPGMTQTAPTNTSTSAPTATSTSSPPATQAAPVSASGFIWPVRGPITQYFSPSHTGIDIGLGETTPPIAAAKAGTVTFAGGDPCCSYGLYVVVDHGDGVTTLYGHLSSIAVSTGQSVTQGQTLGNGGSTGNSTGNHLHFEVRVNGVPQNPLEYLP
jgi:murein DD-endopeptidase MepM/ murein hydrolase activator NlpD